MRLALFLLGAGIGSGTRFVIVHYFRELHRFPTGVLVVNVCGSFLLGLIAADKSEIAYGLMGFCGALTTWSAFALDLFESLRNRASKVFLLNLLLNYGIGIAAALTGIWIAG
ncbi:MAG: CrcB family protein [Actinobacteria bacterium]|nr:CrcB family protein [Actinomycetota bacterium]NDI24112.1 CrcB family protein [Actinomycetota bacterium]